MRILFVDDSDAIRLTLTAILVDSGHVVLEADSLATARIAMIGAKFDLVLLDVHLGDGRGPSLIPEIRAALPDVKIALLTGAPESLEGADLLLIKGEDPFLLVQKM